jgi:hypothetical protein
MEMRHDGYAHLTSSLYGNPSTIFNECIALRRIEYMLIRVSKRNSENGNLDYAATSRIQAVQQLTYILRLSMLCRPDILVIPLEYCETS